MGSNSKGPLKFVTWRLESEMWVCDLNLAFMPLYNQGQKAWEAQYKERNSVKEGVRSKYKKDIFW